MRPFQTATASTSGCLRLTVQTLPSSSTRSAAGRALISNRARQGDMTVLRIRGGKFPNLPIPNRQVRKLAATASIHVPDDDIVRVPSRGGGHAVGREGDGV